MRIKNIFEQLNTQKNSISNRKQLLKAYLYEQIEKQSQHSDGSEDIAYHIAGLLATDLAHELPDDDPYMQALWLAGRLELPEKHRAGATWEEFRRIVEKLD